MNDPPLPGARAAGPTLLDSISISMTRQRVPHRQGSRRRLAARLLFLAGALVGLFAMHGLADHGAATRDVPLVPMSVAVMSMGHTDHTSETTQIPMDDAGTTGSEPSGHSSGMAMAGLCLAALAGVFIGLLLLRPPRMWVAIRPLAVAFVVVRPSGRRDPRPTLPVRAVGSPRSLHCSEPCPYWLPAARRRVRSGDADGRKRRRVQRR